MTIRKSLKEVQCIWMEAGYISYKLCDYNFKCEICPFNKIIQLRNLEKSQNKFDESKQVINIGPKLTPLPDGYFLSKNHIWIKPISQDEVEIGIDSYAQFLLKKMLSIKLPNIDTEIKMSDPLFWIIGSFGVLNMYSPFNGLIIEVNEELLNNFDILKNNDPFDVWILRMKINFSELNFNDFVFNNNYNSFMDDEVNYLNEYFTNFQDKKLVGETLYDGGTLTNEIFDFLSDKEYIILLKTILNKTN